MYLKIAVVGASEAGKTSIVNALGSENEIIPDTAATRGDHVKIPYRPTDSVRIAEVVLTEIPLNNSAIELEVELWEVGGNPRLKAFWPVVQTELDGVIIVYDVNNEQHGEEAAELNMHFVSSLNSGLKPQQCLFVGNNIGGKQAKMPQEITGASYLARSIAGNVVENPIRLRQEFRQFATGLAEIAYEKRRPINARRKSQNIRRMTLAYERIEVASWKK